ncbi:MAG TPA: ribosome small subunit-dependent GTPase A [Prolixibacteraceae bacterium]|nr:ribosome small subunit-dependent GTPase A [Prolixibacteraceae bacterium]
MNNLKQYGWNDWLFRQKEESAYQALEHGRISVTHKTCYEVVSETGFFVCELTGNMLYGRSDYPCTGDWVIFQPVDSGKGIIVDLLPRKKTLYRLKTGTVAEKQAIASHVDKAFIVQSLDNNFNVRRIERFMLQLSEEAIQPALVLTKADMEHDLQNIEKAIKHLSDKMAVFFTSIQEPATIEILRGFISEGETVVFTGSSGVGKSTLINRLCGQDIFPTAAISDSTGKGRHTTTRREMVLLDGSGMLIDTPGVKLFGVTNDHTESLSEILDISHFEGQCRFKDCQHINEKGCAVIEAVENGDLPNEVYESYLKLRKEAWHYTASVYEKRKQEKSFSKMVKEVKNDPLYRG